MKYKINYDINFYKIGGSENVLDNNTVKIYDVTYENFLDTKLYFDRNYTYRKIYDLINVFIYDKFSSESYKFYSIIYETEEIYNNIDRVFIKKSIQFTSTSRLTIISINLNNNDDIYFNNHRGNLGDRLGDKRYIDIVLSDYKYSLLFIYFVTNRMSRDEKALINGYLEIDILDLIINKFNKSKIFVLKILTFIYDIYYVRENITSDEFNKVYINNFYNKLKLIIENFNDSENAEHKDIISYFIKFTKGFIVKDFFDQEIISLTFLNYPDVILNLLNPDIDLIRYLDIETSLKMEIIRKIPNDLKNNKEFIKSLLFTTRGHFDVEYIEILNIMDDSLKTNDEFMIELLKIKPRLLLFENNLSNNKEFIKKCLDEVQDIYNFIKDTYKYDNEIIQKACNINYLNLKYIPIDILILDENKKYIVSLLKEASQNNDEQKILDILPSGIKDILLINFIKSI